MRNTVKRIIALRLLWKLGLPFFGICLVLMLVMVALLNIVGAGFQYQQEQEVSSRSQCVSTVVTKEDGSKETVQDPVPQEYRDGVKKAAETAGIPYEIAGKQLMQESTFNPKAVSPVGAQGLAMFMPDTWRMYGNGGDPFNPDDALEAYGRYMKVLREQVKDLAKGDANLEIQLTLAAYNAGPGNVLKAGGVPNISETKHYVDIILNGAQMEVAKNCSQVTGNKVWNGDLGDGEWTNPCPGCVKTSGYEQRFLAVDAQNHNVHWGYDLATPGAGMGNGVEIIAPTDLKITELYERDGCVMAYAKDPPGFGFAFCHLDSFGVKAGTEVKRGTVLGVEGGTGNNQHHAFATHLHLEIFKPGFALENANWFNARTGWDNQGGNLDPGPILQAKGAAPKG